MEPAEFLVHCQLLLDEDKSAQVVELLREESNDELVKDVGWQLVGVLCKQFTKYYDERKLENIDKCLVHLIHSCSPKEVMLSLAQHLAMQCSEKSFVIIIGLCKQAIVKLKRRQSKYLRNFCKHFVSKINILLKELCKEEENISTEHLHSESIETLCKLVSSSLDFMNGMVPHTGRNKSPVLASYLSEVVTESSWDSYEVSCCQRVLTNFVFDLLHICVEFNTFERTMLSKFKEITTSLVTTVFKFLSFSQLLDYLQLEGCDACHPIGVMSFFYLVLVEGFGETWTPLVYQHMYLFTILQPYVHLSFNSSTSHITKTNIQLLSCLLSELNNCFHNTPVSSVQPIATNLTKIMIWCEDEDVRKQSQSIFVLFLRNMRAESRLPLLRYIYERCDHAGLHGYLIKHINTAIEELHFDENNTSDVDVGELALLFTNIIVGENNVLHESDRYISALNFVRFWLLRDNRNEDRSRVWEKVGELNKSISIIVKCIQVSKKELEEQLNHLNSSSTSSKDDFHTQLLTSLPGGEMFCNLSTNEKTTIVNKSFLTLDVMSSIIARIDEIILQKNI